MCSAEAYVQLSHAAGTITFAIYISLHVSEIEPRPNYPINMSKLNCIKQFGMQLSNAHPMSALITDLPHYQIICDDFLKIYKLPSGFAPVRDIEHMMKL